MERTNLCIFPFNRDNDRFSLFKKIKNSNCPYFIEEKTRMKQIKKGWENQALTTIIFSYAA
jgi:hypothetical protein